MKKLLSCLFLTLLSFSSYSGVVVDEDFEMVNTITRVSIPKDDYSRELRVKVRGLSDKSVSIINHSNLSQRAILEESRGVKLNDNLLKLSDLYGKNVLQVYVPNGYYVTDNVGLTIPPEFLKPDEGINAGVVFNFGKDANVSMTSISFNYQKVSSKLYTMAVLYSINNGEDWTVFDTVLHDSPENEDDKEKAQFYIHDQSIVDGVDCIKILFWGHTKRSGEAQGSDLAFIIDNLVVRKKDNRIPAFSDIKDVKILKEIRRCVGWKFSPTKNITITDLGILDPSGDGLGSKKEQRIRIYEAETEEVLTEAVIKGRVLPERLGKYNNYFVPIKPVDLKVGFSYVILAENPHDYAQRVDMKIAEEIGFENIGYSLNQKTLPEDLRKLTSGVDKTPNCFIGPNFKFRLSKNRTCQNYGDSDINDVKSHYTIRGGAILKVSPVKGRKLRWKQVSEDYVYITPRPRHQFVSIRVKLDKGYSISSKDYAAFYNGLRFPAKSVVEIQGSKRGIYGENSKLGVAKKDNSVFSILYELPKDAKIFDLVFELETTAKVPVITGLTNPFKIK